MCLACDHVELLLFGQVDELDGVTTDADREVGVLFFLGVLHGVDQLVYAKDVHVQVVCAAIEVAVHYANECLYLLILRMAERRGTDRLRVRDTVQRVLVRQLSH